MPLSSGLFGRAVIAVHLPVRNVRGEISVRISTFKKLRRIPVVGVPFPFSIKIGRTNVKPFAGLETVIKAHLRGPFEEFV